MVADGFEAAFHFGADLRGGDGVSRNCGDEPVGADADGGLASGDGALLLADVGADAAGERQQDGPQGDDEGRGTQPRLATTATVRSGEKAVIESLYHGWLLCSKVHGVTAL